MTFQMQRRALMGALGSAALLGAPALRAQSAWPTKPVTLIVPFPAGGGTDAFARPMSAQFARLTGRQMIIDNKGGAGGTLGAGLAAKAAPDGYTLFMGAVHHTIAPSMYPRLDYDIEKDLVPLILVASVPQVVVVNPRKVPVANFKEFLEFARKNPGKLNYGSAGSGTSHHLAGELFKQQTKTFITHIPYRGAAAAVTGLIAGEVDMMFENLPSVIGQIQGGAVRALAVTTRSRSKVLPNVPTLIEAGLKDFDVSAWYGLAAPAGVPAAVMTRLEQALQNVARDAEVVRAMESRGADVSFQNAQAATAFMAADAANWKRVAAFAKITLG